MKEDIKKHISDSISVKQAMLGDDTILEAIIKAADVCINALKKGRKIMIAGNGGSAADAQHIAGELVNRFMFNRPGLAAVALTTDTSVITAISNDYSFDIVFSRQVESIGDEGDVLMLLSTSGRSVNILKAAEAAHKKKITVIGITGKTGGQMEEYCDLIIKAPSDITPRIQECHVLILHIISYLIEERLFER